MTDHVLIVVEALAMRPAAEGTRKTLKYRVRLGADDGEVLLESVRTPFFDAARELLRRGLDPSAVLEMRHRGSSIVALRQAIGRAAKLTVIETNKVGPLIARWVPFPAQRIRPGAASDD